MVDQSELDQAGLLKSLAEAARGGQTLPENWQAFDDEDGVSGIQTVIGDAIFQLILSDDAGPRFRWVREGDALDQEGLRDEQQMIYSTLVHFAIMTLLGDPGLPPETN